MRAGEKKISVKSRRGTSLNLCPKVMVKPFGGSRTGIVFAWRRQQREKIPQEKMTSAGGCVETIEGKIMG